MEEVDIIPESQEPQPDSPAEDVVSVTLKRENSLRHSQRHAMRNGRFVPTPHAPNNSCQTMLYRNIQPPSICPTEADAWSRLPSN